MKQIIATTILALACGCGYSHIASTTGSFHQLAGPLAAGPADLQGGPLVLRIIRQMDTVISGPDIEEDQLLVLELRNFRLNQKLLVPSENVKARFTASRSGPRSEGTTFGGYIIVQSITANRINAYLHLDVTASTADNRYTQVAKFRGEQKFYRETGND